MTDYVFKIGDQIRYKEQAYNPFIIESLTKSVFTITKFYRKTKHTFWGKRNMDGLSLLFYTSEVELVKTPKKRIG